MITARTGPLNYFLLAVVGLGLTACDTSAPVFQNSNEDPRYFSLYGAVTYPDGGAIRVEPLRSPEVDSAFRGEETVTFTQVETEETDTLRLRPDSAEGVPVRNYRTPDALSRGATYRVAVERAGGAASSVGFSIPEDKPKVEVLDTLRYCREGDALDFRSRRALPVRLRIDSVESLGRVAVRYVTRYGVSAPFRVTERAEKQDGDSYLVEVPTDDHLVSVAARNIEAAGPFEPPPPALAQSVMSDAASVGQGSPGREIITAELEELAVPDRYSNVGQGVGLVVGAYPVEVQIPVDDKTSTPGADRPPCPDDL